MSIRQLIPTIGLTLVLFLALSDHRAIFAQINNPTKAQKDDVQLSKTLYSDPKGFFRIRPPEGWLVNEYPSDPRGKVDFNSSNQPPRAQLKVIGQKSPFANFDELLQDCRNGAERVRAKFGGTFNVSKTTKYDVKAVETLWDVPAKFRQKAIHVLLGKNYYTFAFASPPELFEEKYAIVLMSMRTFEPLQSSFSGTAESHIVASKIRTAEFYLQLGRKDWALAVIDEGLRFDKNNKKLLELKEKCLK
ncbi:MAG: hypothetical protein ACFFBS_10080 [Promethearchaeota archaeon]